MGNITYAIFSVFILSTFQKVLNYLLHPNLLYKQVLAELKEYATEVDVDFVRKAVRAIGRCAIKVEPSAEKCVTTLLELIQTKVNYVVQEAIVVIKVSVHEVR